MNQSTTNAFANIPSASFPDLHLAAISASQGRCLPQWEASGAIYHISLHLGDSVPASERIAWLEARARIRERLDDTLSPPTPFEREALVDEMREVYSARVERFLAAGNGACLLRDPRAADIVARVLEHDNATRYALHAYTIMPNHIHVIVGGFGASGSLATVLKEWKSITSHRVNALFARHGELWHRDAYTHIIRNAAEYKDQLDYVWHNPDAASLTDGYKRKSFIPR